MQMIFKNITICIPLLLIWCNSYATNYKLTDNTCIATEFKKDKLLIYQSDCINKTHLLDEFQVPNDIPKFDFVFQEFIKNKKYIILSISYNDNYRDIDNKINYADRYHLIYAYQCEEKCKFDSKLSGFWGSGGDLIDIYTDKIVYIFPYANEQSTKDALKSNLFNKWFYNKNMKGKILKKTYINEDSKFSLSHVGYLIKGDQFIIKDISSKWLNIIYTNKKGNKIIGWIDCNDTDVCNN